MTLSALRSLLLLVATISLHTSAAKAEPIGVILPLSGGWQSWGERIRDGLELYREEHLSEFPYTFVYEDEETCNTKKAVSAYQHIRRIHNVKMFVVGCASGTESIAPIAAKDNVLLFSSGFQQSSLFQKDYRVVNFALQVGSEGRVIGEFLKQQGKQRIGILRNPEGDEFVSEMRDVFSGTNSEIVAEEILAPDDIGINSFVTKLRVSRVDAVFMNLSELQLIAAIKSLREQRLQALLVTSYGTEILSQANSEVLKLAEGVYYSFPEASPGSIDFQNRFQARFNTNPTVNSAFVYDGMDMLQSALKECSAKEDKQSCIFKAITSRGPQQRLSGSFEILSNGSINRQFAMKVIRNGKPTRVQDVTEAQHHQ